MPEHTESAKRYCDMDKFAQSICQDMTLTEEEANKFIGLLWQQSQCDVAEVKHGKWIGGRYNEWKNNEYEEQCSICGRYSTEYGMSFCPNCGARMDKE